MNVGPDEEVRRPPFQMRPVQEQAQPVQMAVGALAVPEIIACDA